MDNKQKTRQTQKFSDRKKQGYCPLLVGEPSIQMKFQVIQFYRGYLAQTKLETLNVVYYLIQNYLRDCLHYVYMYGLDVFFWLLFLNKSIMQNMCIKLCMEYVCFWSLSVKAKVEMY